MKKLFKDSVVECDKNKKQEIYKDISAYFSDDYLV